MILTPCPHDRHFQLRTTLLPRAPVPASGRCLTSHRETYTFTSTPTRVTHSTNKPNLRTSHREESTSNYNRQTETYNDPRKRTWPFIQTFVSVVPLSTAKLQTTRSKQAREDGMDGRNRDLHPGIKTRENFLKCVCQSRSKGTSFAHRNGFRAQHPGDHLFMKYALELFGLARHSSGLP